MVENLKVFGGFDFLKSRTRRGPRNIEETTCIGLASPSNQSIPQCSSGVFHVFVCIQMAITQCDTLDNTPNIIIVNTQPANRVENEPLGGQETFVTEVYLCKTLAAGLVGRRNV